MRNVHRTLIVSLALVGSVLTTGVVPALAADRGTGNPVVAYYCDGSVRLADGSVRMGDGSVRTCDGSVRPIR